METLIRGILSMKKLAIIVTIVLILLCGCSNSKSNIHERFIQVEDGGCYSIIVDTKTDVIYLRYNGGAYKGITVLLNSDGTPMLWNGDM